jgi:hypothetical protein
MTKRCIFVVLTNAKDGREDEFDAWYDSQHIPDMLKVPGIISGHRYQRHHVIAGSAEVSPYRTLALYEVESDDLQLVFDGIRDRRRSMQWTDSIDNSRHAFWVYCDPDPK